MTDSLSMLNKRSLGKKEQILGWFEIACIFFVLLLLISRCFSGVLIEGASMEDTYQDKDRVLLQVFLYNIKIHDVVVFYEDRINGPNGKPVGLCIKRVMALGGDAIKFEKESSNDVTFYRRAGGEGEWEKEPDYFKITRMTYNTGSFPNTMFNITWGEEMTVPKDCFFVMGDNRDHSSDSRTFGYVDKSQIEGRVVLDLKEGTFLRWYYSPKTVGAP